MAKKAMTPVPPYLIPEPSKELMQFHFNLILEQNKKEAEPQEDEQPVDPATLKLKEHIKLMTEGELWYAIDWKLVYGDARDQQLPPIYRRFNKKLHKSLRNLELSQPSMAPDVRLQLAAQIASSQMR